MWNFLFMQDIMNAYLKQRYTFINDAAFHGKAAITMVRAPFLGFPFFSQDMQLHQQMIIVRYGHNVRNYPNRKQSLLRETNNKRKMCLWKVNASNQKGDTNYDKHKSK